MSVILYFDEDAQEKEVIRQVRYAGLFASSVNEQHTQGWTDEEQLIFAASKGWTIFTHNEVDFERLHSHWLLDSKCHHGIIIANKEGSTARERAARLVTLVKARSARQMLNNLEYLSSW